MLFLLILHDIWIRILDNDNFALHLYFSQITDAHPNAAALLRTRAKMIVGEWECPRNFVVVEQKNEFSFLSPSYSDVNVPPHCHITLKCTKEIAGFNGLSDAVRRLDFRSSVRDQRRFQYICALLRLLVTNKGITSLSGGAQRLLLQMLEDVATYVSDSQQNINVLRGLVNQLHHIVNQENQKCWGKPLGSQSLWEGHVQTIQRIQDIASQIEIREVISTINSQLASHIIINPNYSRVLILVQNCINYQRNALEKSSYAYPIIKT